MNEHARTPRSNAGYRRRRQLPRFAMLADGSALQSSKDWVRFCIKTSRVFTASALAAFEGVRRVRHVFADELEARGIANLVSARIA
jgi:hypothetical protein